MEENIVSPFAQQKILLAEVDMKKIPKGRIEVKMDKVRHKIVVLLVPQTIAAASRS